jgi:hypothetical protein
MLTGSQEMDKTIGVSDYATVLITISPPVNQIKLILIIIGFLEKEDSNFISVDWRQLAAGPDYPRAVANVQLVGSLTGSFVKFLVSKGADLRRVHLIGFSLGAHVVGRAGQTMNSEIPRITGTHMLIVSWFRQI